MAYTRSPDENTHDTVRIPAVGSPFEVANNTTSIPQTLNYINCYPIEETQFGENPTTGVEKRDAFKTGIYSVTLTGLSNFGPTVLFDENLTTSSIVNVSYAAGTTFITEFFITGSTGLTVSSTFKGISAGPTNIIYRSGTQMVDPSSNLQIGAAFIGDTGVVGVAPQVVLNLPSAGGATATALAQTLDTAAGLVYLDSYLFAVGSINSGSTYNVIYNSSASLGYGTWNTTEYMPVDIFAGNIKWIDKHRNHLVAFCDNSIEFFYDAATTPGSPLARQPIFARNIGILAPAAFSTTTAGAIPPVAKIGDDIYFVGKSSNSLLDVYQLSNFQLKVVGTHYIRSVLNYFVAGTYEQLYSIETVIINNHSMILIMFTGGNSGIVYFPESDVWWNISLADYLVLSNQTHSQNIAVTNSSNSGATRPYYLTTNGSNLVVNTTDLEQTISVTSTYYTEVIDFGSPYWKHLGRVMAVGDYGPNSLTLWYGNDPTYTTFVQCTTKSPSANGFQNMTWWDNVTYFHRGTLRIDISGVGPAIHRGFDVEYDIGTD